MKQYMLAQTGRYAFLLEAKEKKAAQAELKEAVEESLANCRARFGSGTKHGTGDSYEITIGPDRRSALWTRLALVEV